MSSVQVFLTSSGEVVVNCIITVANSPKRSLHTVPFLATIIPFFDNLCNMSGFWDNGPKSRHRYTVASAPTVIGSVFKRIFQLFLGQCTYCKFKKLGMCTSDGSALRLSLTAPCIDFIRVNVACPSVDYSSTLYTVKKNSEIRTNKFKTDFSKCAILQHSDLNGFWLLAIYT